MSSAAKQALHRRESENQSYSEMSTHAELGHVEHQPQSAQTFLSQRSTASLAKGLGWFSIGLGLAELLAPKGLSRLIGIKEDHSMLIRLCGLREITSGVGILTQNRPAGWMWSRVAGDALDIALLGAAFSSDNADRTKLMAATAAVGGVTMLDLLCSQQLSNSNSTATVHKDSAVRVVKSITINRPVEEVYAFWRDFENLPRFMRHLESVKVTGDGRSNWVAKAPAGTTVEWDALTINETPNERIAWRSVEGADVDNAGSVQFKSSPQQGATEIKVEIQYNPPMGTAGSYIAMLFGEEPEQQVQEDLRRFKQFIETGEIATTEGQPSGRSPSASLGR